MSKQDRVAALDDLFGEKVQPFEEIKPQIVPDNKTDDKHDSSVTESKPFNEPKTIKPENHNTIKQEKGKGVKVSLVLDAALWDDVLLLCTIGRRKQVEVVTTALKNEMEKNKTKLAQGRKLREQMNKLSD